MQTRLWIIFVVVVAWTSFLIGYSVSALTGGKPPAPEVKGAGGYGGGGGQGGGKRLTPPAGGPGPRKGRKGERRKGHDEDPRGARGAGGCPWNCRSWLCPGCQGNGHEDR